MTTYTMLANWTDRGLQAVTDGPKRMDNVKKMLADMGGRMQSLYLDFGPFGEVKRRKTSALLDADEEAWDFRRFVHVRAKLDNRPAIGLGSLPPRPTAPV
jgi:uncharacterized protein with GYD domain